MKWVLLVLLGALGGPALAYGVCELRARRAMRRMWADHYYGVNRV
jgi:hypothetical protein